jgi:hypothetical protein
MMAQEQKIINRHLLVEVLKIYHTCETEVDQAKMLDARIALANIADMVPNTYNTNEGWVVKKMKPKYVIRIIAILPIIY